MPDPVDQVLLRAPGDRVNLVHPVRQLSETLEAEVATALGERAIRPSMPEPGNQAPIGRLLGSMRPDFILLDDAGEPQVVLETMVWVHRHRAFLRNRSSDLLGRSVRYRRALNSQTSLSLILLLADDGHGDVDPRSSLLELQSLLRRDSGDAGFDHVVVGLQTSGAYRGWTTVTASGPQPVPNFLAAVNAVVGAPSTGVEHKVASGPRPWEGSKDLAQTTWLLVADEWAPEKGGLSTFNRELATSLAGQGATVFVTLPEATLEARDSATECGVTLVTPLPLPGITDKSLLLTPPGVPGMESEPDVIVGHGRILGPYAYALQKLFYPNARRVHFVHMDAEQLESAKEAPAGPSRMSTADGRRRLELDLAASANVVAGVGPLLTRSISDQLRAVESRPSVVTFLPGLRPLPASDAAPLGPPENRQILIIARAEDLLSKGIDTAVQATVQAARRFPTRPGAAPTLVIRGVPPEEAGAVKVRLEGIAEPTMRVVMRPYSSNPGDILSDLRQSRLLLMPSRHEGFGLVAFEAIAAAVPILVTFESGVAQFLAENTTDADRDLPREVLATRDEQSVVVDDWATAIHAVLVDPHAAQERARDLRDQVAAKASWSTSINQLMDALNASG